METIPKPVAPYWIKEVLKDKVNDILVEQGVDNSEDYAKIIVEKLLRGEREVHATIGSKTITVYDRFGELEMRQGLCFSDEELDAIVDKQMLKYSDNGHVADWLIDEFFKVKHSVINQIKNGEKSFEVYLIKDKASLAVEVNGDNLDNLEFKIYEYDITLDEVDFNNANDFQRISDDTFTCEVYIRDEWKYVEFKVVSIY